MQEVYGWDISSHTMNHVDVSQIKNVQRLENELVHSKQFLVDNGFIKGAEHFAYPFGNFDNDLSMDLIKEHYKTARIVRGDIETIPTPQPISPLAGKRKTMRENRTALARESGRE